jgi:hypothetical protein
MTVCASRRYHPKMKVVPESSGVSALDTWLRDAGVPARAPDHISVTGTNAATTASSVSDVTQQQRDTAEDLLVLNVWSGRPAGQLRTVDFPALPDSDATVQHWAEHIFSPLR